MIKTITFAAIHFTIATLLAFTLTGDFLLGSLIAIIEPSINTVAFYFHEKAWQTSPYLKQRKSNTQVKTASFAVIHFSVAFTVTYGLTGDAFLGGLMATIEPAINSVAYFFHEKVWTNKEANRHQTHIVCA
ncbi:membrane protein [Psychromonas marina]|uniref:Membrane protein n=1 Tax=Psychromonas marina TaxID=88364 RepID=A0ABQ6DVT1_9GAMM|nr:membrane protein [Psychromonas marina]